ncbi:MAG: DUF4296 domain-containing protein [Bacteroidales bacterium]|nr:DUF4296 domain-containing protein [Bacteroidales bacterium]
MNRYIIVIVLWLLACLSISCSHYKVKKPSHLMSKAEVEEVVYQIYVIEGEARLLYMEQPANEVKRWVNETMNALFAAHEVDYNIVKENINYYYADEKQAKAMQTDVTNRLLQKQAQITKQVQETNRVTDTIITGENQSNILPLENKE